MQVRTFLFLGLLGALSAAPFIASAAEERQVVAQAADGPGFLLRRENSTSGWQLAAKKEGLHTGDLLLAPAGAAIDGKNGAVRLVLDGSAGINASLPAIESAVVLYPGASVDLDFALLRGKVELVNQKSKGEARVRVRGQQGVAEIRLLEPGSRVALVVFGRWAPGVPFRKDARPEEHKPGRAFLLLVLHGQVEVKTAKHLFVLEAPPGPALLEGNDTGDTDPAARRLEKLPAWATAKPAGEDTKAVQAGLARFADLARKKSPAEAVRQLLKSDQGPDRRIAVDLLGATDDLDGLTTSLTSAATSDVWENSVGVARHWIGREPGQDLRLYEALVDKRKLTPAQAETVLQLLHNFSDEAVRLPETYEALLDLLGSKQLAIRGLAHWHLYRLVPAGRKIGYDPLSPAEKRTAAAEKWRQLIPAGKLPPAK